MPGRTEARFTPILTYTIIVLNSVLFLWDREGQIMGPSLVFGDLGMRPAELANSLAGVAAAAPVGIFQSDGDGNCLFVNERWCEITGLSVDEAAGRGWAQGLHPDDRADALARIDGEIVEADRQNDLVQVHGSDELEGPSHDGRVANEAGLVGKVPARLDEEALGRDARRVRTGER